MGGCKWPYDVCSYTWGYRRSSCGALDAAGSAETPEAEAVEELNAAKFNASLQASVAAAGGSEGVFHWKCNCRSPLLVLQLHDLLPLVPVGGRLLGRSARIANSKRSCCGEQRGGVRNRTCAAAVSVSFAFVRSALRRAHCQRAAVVCRSVLG